MTKRIRLAALAIAAAIAVSGSPMVHADNHGETVGQLVDEKYKRQLRSLSDKQLRQMIVNLKSRLVNRDNAVLRAQLQTVRAERSRRRAAGSEPSNENAFSKAEKQARRLLRGAEPTNSLRSPALITRIKAIRVLLKSKGLRDGTRGKLTELMQQDRSEWQRRDAVKKKPTKNERSARKLLQGSESNGLQTDALRQRIQSAHDLVNGEGLQDRTREKLFNLYKADRAEYEQRRAQTQEANENQATDAERNARQVLKSGAASTLDASQLRERIAISRNLLSSGDLTAPTSSRLKKLIKADKVALNRHQNSRQVTEAERNARQLLDNARPSSELRTAALRERIRQGREFLQFKELRRRTRRDLQELVQSDRNALENLNHEVELTDAERQARRILADNETPNRLDGGVLRERIRQTRSLLQDRDITRNTRRKLQARLERDQKELRTRDVNTSQKSHADDLARQLLNDTRSAQNLPERRLKDRLRETRDLLQDRQLSDRYSRRLRERLRDDRLELRRRVEARRNDDSGIDLVVVEPRGDAGALLNDRRQSHALRTKQLTHRIRRTRDLLNNGGLNSYQQSELTNILRTDRRELRNRLQSRRDRRRSELTRLRRNNEINIVIAPKFDYAPRDDVAAAEADDDVIERQLVAPPTRQIDRRYSMDEFRQRPELRNYMPAVEVDSIRFGFNEHFLREEEVDALERLGAIIERVVATNPNEVFLIEGHTDAVGSYGYNQGLSVKRADAVRSTLLEFFVIDRANLSTIGYGEQFLKIPTEENEPENRRVTVRRITPLLANR